MPELPEIETIKRYLEKDLIGRKIKDVKILNKKSFIGDKRKILNSKIFKIERRGKMLIFKLAADKHGSQRGLTLIDVVNADKRRLQRRLTQIYINASDKYAPHQKFDAGRPKPCSALVWDGFKTDDNRLTTTDQFGFETDKFGYKINKNQHKSFSDPQESVPDLHRSVGLHKSVLNPHKSANDYPYKSVLNLKSASIRWLVFHLKLTGQLIFYYTNGNESLNEWQRIKNIKNTNGNEFIDKWQRIRYTRVIFILDKGFLIFNDARKFGWVKVLDDEDLNKELSKIGKEPFDLNFKYLKEIFSKIKRPIKIVLMDQKKIAGLGNIYANEALFLAKIHPLKPANKLKDNEIKNLLAAIKKVIKKAIKLQGTSFRFYVKPDESKGSYQEEFLVYQRKDEKCLRCKSKIKYIKIGGRGSFYCPRCQKI
jgi:formamidopyrimidine-DNA glycosylase